MAGNRRLAAVVLCGGRSTRMGRDKALIEVDGVPLVVRVAELMEIVARPVLLATGTPGRLGDRGYREVADELPGAGPLSGVAAGLAASPHPLTAVVAADMPFASPSLFGLLAGLHAKEHAVVPVSGRGPEPLHAVYAREALPIIRRCLSAGMLAMVEVLDELDVRLVRDEEWRSADPSGMFAVNLNRAEDLALLDRRTP